MEAILAAVYLDGGMEEARRIVQLHWPKAEEVQRPMQDSKGALQEFLQRDGGEAPPTASLGRMVPPTTAVSPPRCCAISSPWPQGTGRTKKQAEQAAALAALQALQASK